MFSVCQQPSIHFNSQSQNEKKGKSISIGTQTEAKATLDKEVQSLTLKDESIQVNLERHLTGGKPSFNPNKLVKFLDSASKLTIKEIEESIAIEQNLKLIELMSNESEELNCNFYYSPAKSSSNLKSDQDKKLTENEDSLSKLRIEHLAWSCNFNQLIIGYSVKEHSYWCTHSSKIEFCNLYQTSVKRPNLLKTIFEIEIKNCITQLISHPIRCNQIAIGTKSGALQIIDRELAKTNNDDRKCIKHESNLHKLEITYLSFKKSLENNLNGNLSEELRSNDNNLYDELISCSLDGTYILWRIKQFEQQLQPIKIFSLSKQLIKQQIQLGISCATLAPEQESLLIACENYLFSTLISNSARRTDELTVDFEYEQHKGQIKSIEFNYLNSNLFLTNGEDGEIRLYQLNLRKPLLIIYLDRDYFNYKWINFRSLAKQNANNNHLLIGFNENNLLLLNLFKKDEKYFTSYRTHALKDTFQKLFINRTNQLALINSINEIYLFDLNVLLR